MTTTTDNAEPRSPKAALRPLSAELRELVATLRERPISLADMLTATQGRGYPLLLLVIALPFVTPVPLPGVSFPFGCVIALLGFRMLLDSSPWLPRILLQRKLPQRSFGMVLTASARLVGGIERFLRPRLFFIERHAVFARTAGFLITMSGLMLMLPLPLPFSNSLPAWTVIFLSAGALAADGLFFIVGCVAFAVSVLFFTLVFLAALKGWSWFPLSGH